ncbi:unnamed protein product [Absidia cylindrospora]
MSTIQTNIEIVLTVLFFFFGLHPKAANTIPYSPQSGGKVAPLLPAEYAFNFIQHKWNENGFGVSHVASGTWLSSLKENRVRVDISNYDWVSNNATIKGNIHAGTVTSLFDFNHVAKSGNVTNIYINTNNDLKPSCSMTEMPQTQAQGQVFPVHFIQQHGMYAGQETIQGIGATYMNTNKWIVFFGDTLVSFYFTADNDDWVRYDENAQAAKTSVVTWIYNLNQKATFDKTVFSITSCPAATS